MLKKYLPYIFLVASALLLLYIIKNQRGEAGLNPHAEGADAKITVPAVLPAGDQQDEPEGFNRNAESLIFSKHAQCRMACRKIDETEVRIF